MTAVIEAQGELLRVKLKMRSHPIAHDTGQRGAILGFSSASRRRMIEFMARLATKGVRATFLTLTFSGTPTAAEAKAAFKRFMMRLRRRYENVSGIWRMEFQERGSIHFHVLLFRLPFIPQHELQATWEACTREERSILDVRLCHSRKKITNYISKYMAKVEEHEGRTSLEDGAYQHAHPEDSPGRFWGYINKECLPLGEKLEGTLISRDVFLYLHWTIRKLSRGRGGACLSRATLFSRDAYAMFARAMELGGLYACEQRKVYRVHWRTKIPITLLQRAFFDPTERKKLLHNYAKIVKVAQHERSELDLDHLAGYA